MNRLGIDFDTFSETRLNPFQLRYNVAPTTYVPGIRYIDFKRKLSPFKWGLIPAWAKDMKIATSAINARGETVHEKPMFRAAFKARRCLIPVSGYYEWKPEGKIKRPYNVHRPDDEPMMFAGLWESWKPPEGGEPIESCTIVTTSSAPEIDWLHDRMPVILDENQLDEWMDPENKDVESLKRFIRPYAGPLNTHKLEPIVNSVKNQGPECLTPATESAVDG